jgi:hypothetical protein
LRAGADVHARNTENITAAHTAASKGFVPCLEALIFAGAEVNGCGKRLCTPLHFAAHDGHLDCVQLLLLQVRGLEARGGERKEVWGKPAHGMCRSAHGWENMRGGRGDTTHWVVVEQECNPIGWDVVAMC